MTSHALDVPAEYTYGALFIGWTFATVCYGLTCSQTVAYFNRFVRDHAYLKSTVMILWCLETFHLVLLSYSMYQYFVKSHGYPEVLVDPSWSIKLQLIPASLILGTIQYIWIMRAWTLSRHKWRTYFAYGMLGMIVTDWGFSLTWLASIMKVHDFSHITRQKWHLGLAIGFTTLTDLCVTVYFCVAAHQTRDGLARTNSLINQLIIYVVNTGVVTVLGTVGLLVTTVAYPGRLYYIAIYMVLPKLYLNSHLAMLNARKSSHISMGDGHDRDGGYGVELTTVPLATLSRYAHFG
ncbi:hypothetical protein BXZ70DRAFT_914571, partial [Cristinia sonorae]